MQHEQSTPRLAKWSQASAPGTVEDAEEALTERAEVPLVDVEAEVSLGDLIDVHEEKEAQLDLEEVAAYGEPVPQPSRREPQRAQEREEPPRRPKEMSTIASPTPTQPLQRMESRVDADAAAAGTPCSLSVALAWLCPGSSAGPRRASGTQRACTPPCPEAPRVPHPPSPHALSALSHILQAIVSAACTCVRYLRHLVPYSNSHVGPYSSAVERGVARRRSDGGGTHAR
ncbi:hypothetical protein K438DRAFT_1981421 [Mycena galopus ATCC 62051]|nr:hypothetical protein K438DRAFT_1981421 [Mycena galopus ATCC 62051]